MEGDELQLLFGVGEAGGQHGGALFEAEIEDGSDEGDGEHGAGKDDDEQSQPTGGHAGFGHDAVAVGGKTGGGHSGVVHAGNGDAHDDGSGGAQAAHTGVAIAQVEGDPQGSAGSDDGDDHRQEEQGRVVADGRRHAHGCHAGVVHGADAGSHDESAGGEATPGEMALADDPQGKQRGGNRDQEGKEGDGGVIAHGNGQTEGQHAEKMHGPDADSHGDGATGEPPERGASFGGGDAGSHIQRGVGGEHRHQQGDDDEPEVIGPGQHGERSAA